MFKKQKYALSAAALVGVLSLSSLTPALAADEATSGSVELTNARITPFGSQSVGGGTWSYGTENVGSQKHVWSIYDHAKKSHKASTRLGSDSDTSGWKYAGTTAKSEIYGSKSATGHAYWDVIE
ncbi:lactococcin 972 family bacteriocin [Paenibacillus peoriae]|uniref:lactococcin 972 family bacteriocin n=1 Tax=Paenibacillus TaxID=44249 RepID=UPI00026C5DE1|nr:MULTISPECIES: lactococcin 972 family bacteriocin [Paenibacillus]MEC0183445.1 lactococcin 972 family bacteriocin [Paenibacillus peoriae]